MAGTGGAADGAITAIPMVKQNPDGTFTIQVNLQYRVYTLTWPPPEPAVAEPEPKHNKRKKPELIEKKKLRAQLLGVLKTRPPMPQPLVVERPMFFGVDFSQEEFRSIPLAQLKGETVVQPWEDVAANIRDALAQYLGSRED